MGKYSSDSDDDRRHKHKSSRKRDRRSRSRERRRRSRSRERRRSRSSSYDDRRDRGRKDRRYSRSSSRSSSSGDDDRRRSRKDNKKSSSSATSSQVTKEKTKEKMKKALARAESKDDVLKREKVKKELEQLAPDQDAILAIESNEFVPQSFTSSASSKTQQNDEKDIGGNHEEAIFGPSGVESSPLPSVAEIKTPSLPALSPTVDKESLFASWLHEDEETKTARWITKLKKMRQELLAAT